MKYRTLVVDDETLARKLLIDHIQKLPQLEIAGQCKTAIEAQTILREDTIDILLLDIQMPDLTGLEFLKMLDKKPATIFTTAYAEYAVEGYELDVVDYLLKPIVFERFFKAINRAMEKIGLSQLEQVPTQVAPPLPVQETTTRDSLFVKTDQRLVQVAYEDIRYIEGLREYIRIHTTTDKLIVLQSLSRLLEALPNQHFARIHRSYIVNITHIDSIVGNMAYLGNDALPISTRTKGKFSQYDQSRWTILSK
ncbi:MAG: LytTR family DNA-binding domain-containing protein [Bacteroidota bacterium]